MLSTCPKKHAANWYLPMIPERSASPDLAAARAQLDAIASWLGFAIKKRDSRRAKIKWLSLALNLSMTVSQFFRVLPTVTELVNV